MYTGMSKLSQNLLVDRGIALHKLIRLLTLSLSQGGYLNFMGNEFGHPEWIDFPREGNNWSFKYARRQWNLADDDALKYKYLNTFDAAMIHFVEKHKILDAPSHVIVQDNDTQILAYLRNDALFVFNLSPSNSYTGYELYAPEGEYKMVLNSDSKAFGGFGNIDETVVYKTFQKNGAPHLRLYLPARAGIVLKVFSQKEFKADLQKKYPQFHYLKYEFEVQNNEIFMQFFFQAEELIFTPNMKLKLGKYAQNMHKNEMEGLVFNIGLIEVVSYWKATCSPNIVIHDYVLDKKQQDWWKKLYYKGLGEFFYQNKIECSPDDFVQFSFAENAKPYSDLCFKQIGNSQKVIVPVGGGKDSVVTLEELKNKKEVIPFIINPRGATLDCAQVAGFKGLEDIVILEREIDANLLTCNKQGFLNGHTPFSAMLAFYTLLASYGTGAREIALSNEASANEATVLGTEVNHQYSKSLEFENDFQDYVQNYMGSSAHYYSYLRNFSELQIAEKFAKYPQYFPVFRSCNAGSKENKWCCNCPKCLFAYIILAPFMEKNALLQIFGEDLLNKPEMQHFLNQLTGKEPTKPFECVGTVEEVTTALKMLDEK
jgi:hypothetical protein